MVGPAVTLVLGYLSFCLTSWFALCLGLVFLHYMLLLGLININDTVLPSIV